MDESRELIESAGLDEARIIAEYERERAQRSAEERFAEERLRRYAADCRQFSTDELISTGEDHYVRVVQGYWELRLFPPASVEVHHLELGRCAEFSWFEDGGFTAAEVRAITMGDLQNRLRRWVREHGE